MKGPASHKQISRVTRSREQAEQSYDRMSRSYDLFAGIYEKKHRDLALRRLEVAEGERILEIGFGTGHSLLQIAGLVGEKGTVCGIDLSSGMVNIARRRLEKAGLSNRAELVRGDALNMPWKDRLFDAVFMSFTLELFDSPEIPLVLKEIERVLKAGGRLGTVCLSRAPGNSLMLRLYEWAHRRFPRYVDCRPIYPVDSLKKADFEIRYRETGRLSGLPVEILVGVKALKDKGNKLDRLESHDVLNGDTGDLSELHWDSSWSGEKSP